jgi:Sulfotransferase domain
MDQPHHHAVGRPPVALCHAHANVKKQLPNFLIISPPKTGSTWLAANLRCHPGIFVPEMKEVKYFSMYHRWLDLGWYARQFQDAGSRLKGEASPSYGLLPVQMIRWVHALMPRVKLVFLMREPIARAWSHARHNFRYRETAFAGYEDALETVPDEKWRESFHHPWLLASADYLGQLQRWLSVFPREQIYVDLYERLATEPRDLLLRVLRFLGADTKHIDWTQFRTDERILPGVEKALPTALAVQLRQLLHDRSLQLRDFLQKEFGLRVTQTWSNTLGDEQTPAKVPPSHPMFSGANDDEYLADLLETEIQSSDPQLILQGYHEHNVVLHRGRFLALAQSLGEMAIEALNTAVACEGDSPGILQGDSLAHVKERVAEHAFKELQEKERSAADNILQLQHQLDALRLQHAALNARVSAYEPFIHKLWRSLPFRLHRQVRRWLSPNVRRDGPHRRELFASQTQLDALLPPKPP